MSGARALPLALVLLILGALAPAAMAGDLPAGFQDTIAIQGLNGPTAVRFAPDGEVFVAQKNGKILRFDDVEDKTPTLFADLRKAVYDNGDRGLLGLAVDPQYPTRPYVYALYTFDHVLGEDAPGSYPRWGKAAGNYEGDPCPMPVSPGVDACPVSGQLTRLTAQGGVAGAEKVLVEDWCQQDSSHSIGGLQFGPEGALFASGGEGASFLEPDYGQFGWPHKNQCGDPPGGEALSLPSAEGGSLRSQDLFTPYPADPTGLDGTLIRIDPDTGAGLPGNPRYSSLDANERRIVAYGFRNPFRFAIDPDREEVLVNNVGNGTDEEIDRIGLTPSTPYNSGWPCYEGDHRNPDFNNLDIGLCESLYAQPGVASAPFFSYLHDTPVAPGDSDDTCPSQMGSAITGSALYPDGTFPPRYDGALFFADAVRGCIYAMLAGGGGEGPDPDAVEPFLTEGGPYTGADIEIGPDGNLYYLSLFGDEAVHRVSYESTAPVAKLSVDKEWGGLPLSVTFDAGGSTGNGLQYAWDLNGDGSFETNGGITQTRSYNTAVNKTISVRVKTAAGLTSTAAVTIYPGDSPPKVSIDSPAETLTWAVGQQIAFGGSAVSDSGNGTAIAPQGLSWRTKILHCPVDEASCHAHPLPDFNNTASGVLTAVDHNLPSRLRFELTATDARGLSATKVVEIQPRTVVLSAGSDPPGVTLSLGASNGPEPLSLTLIEGASATVSAPATAEINGVTYDFVSWSDGGPRVHSVLVDEPTDYVAHYAESEGPQPPDPDPNPPGPGPPGPQPPVTGSQPPTAAATPRPPLSPELKRHPAARTAATTARFEFDSVEAGVGFACQLDERPLEPCGSPRAYKRLKLGKHVFRVHAEAPGESVEYSPATVFRWQVLAKRR